MDLDRNRKLITAALAAAGRGDRDALQTVYRLTAAKLFAVCMRILGERSEAEHSGSFGDISRDPARLITR